MNLNGRKKDFNALAKKVLMHEKVMCGLSTVSGLNRYDEDVFELKRIGIGSDITKSRFKLNCSGFNALVNSILECLNIKWRLT